MWKGTRLLQGSQPSESKTSAQRGGHPWRCSGPGWMWQLSWWVAALHVAGELELNGR